MEQSCDYNKSELLAAILIWLKKSGEKNSEAAHRLGVKRHRFSSGIYYLVRDKIVRVIGEKFTSAQPGLVPQITLTDDVKRTYTRSPEVDNLLQCLLGDLPILPGKTYDLVQIVADFNRRHQGETKPLENV